jgi:hypothetical protein
MASQPLFCRSMTAMTLGNGDVGDYQIVLRLPTRLISAMMIAITNNKWIMLPAT